MVAIERPVRRVAELRSFGNTMKTNLIIVAFVCLLLVALVLGVSLSVPRGHNPRDLSYWGLVAASRDWSLAAAQGDPQAQCLHGLSLVRTNLFTRGIDRVPVLSAVPIIGKRYFETISYELDGRVTPAQLADAYRWIKQAADKGFAPAKEAQKLFIGRIGTPTQGGATNGSQPIPSETNSAAAATGSRR